jgi:hypothetical protein
MSGPLGGARQELADAARRRRAAEDVAARVWRDSVHRQARERFLQPLDDETRHLTVALDRADTEFAKALAALG